VIVTKRAIRLKKPRMKLNPEFEKKSREYIQKWDLDHPIDYLWRKSFNIPFGSPEHMAASFVDQWIWYEEQQFVKEITANAPKRSSSSGKRYTEEVKQNPNLYKEYGFKDSDDVDKTIEKYRGEGGQALVDNMLKRVNRWQGIR